MTSKSGKTGSVDRLNFFEQLCESYADAIAVVDKKGTIKFANNVIITLFGFKKRPSSVNMYEWMKKAFRPEKRSKEMWKLWNEDAKAPNPPPRRICFGHSDKKKFWWRFKMTHMPNGDIVISGQDVTDRVKMDEILERAQFAMDHAADPVFWMGTDARFLYVNEAACNSLGYTKEELLSMTVHDIDPQFPKKAWPAHWRSVKREKCMTIESVHRRKDGTTFPVEITANFQEHDGREYNYAIARDILVRKSAETALRESEEKFRNLAEYSPNMIFINQRGRIVYANMKCEEVMGYTREEFYDQSFSFMQLMAPESRDLVKRNFQKHVKGKDIPSYEYALMAKSGKRVHAVINSKLISYEGGKAVLGIVTDITDLKVAEEMLQASAQELEAKKIELERKNAALKEILAQIEEEKLEIRKQVAINTDKFIKPIIRKLKNRSEPSNLRSLELLERTLNDLTSEFGARAVPGSSGLTPRQLEICNMIRSNMSSKEIADMLHLSLRTVETHRNTIRKRLGISGKEYNLAGYLQSIG